MKVERSNLPVMARTEWNAHGLFEDVCRENNRCPGDG